MKKLTVMLAMCCLLSLPSVGMAEDIDMAKVTCKEFTSSDKDGMSMMLTWIDGYMSAKSDNTVMSDEWMEKLATHMGSYCVKHQNKTIMDAMDSMPSN